MLYAVALILPPLAVLLCGKPFQALLNIFLCLLVIVPGVVHALFVVHNYYADQRNQRLVQALQQREAPPPPP